LYAPEEFLSQETIIKGDDLIPVISCASIVAKVKRDRYMIRLHKTFPQYGFDEHKGYGTLTHRKAIKKYGISSFHRKSFLKKFIA
jgi:ribonuclease HII